MYLSKIIDCCKGKYCLQDYEDHVSYMDAVCFKADASADVEYVLAFPFFDYYAHCNKQYSKGTYYFEGNIYHELEVNLAIIKFLYNALQVARDTTGHWTSADKVFKGVMLYEI